MTPLVELKDISFSYPERPLFTKLNLALWPGQRLGLTGPNGAGKTTLLRLILGLEKAQGGEILFEGRLLQKEKDFYPLRQKIGLVFQDPDDQLFCPTVEEDLAFGPLNLGLSREEVARRLAEVIELLGLKGFEKRYTYKLSGGEKRLVALGTVLTMRPQFLLLDEPTGDLDQKNLEKLLFILKEHLSSYLVISHDLAFLEEVCTEIFWLENGKLAFFKEGKAGKRQALSNFRLLN